MAKKKAKKRKIAKPRVVGADGRTKTGKFAKGNSLSVGNKSHTNEKALALKKALLDAITQKDITAIGKKLVEKAKEGDIQSAKEIFDRLWGRALQEVDIGENTISNILDIMAIIGISDAANGKRISGR